MNLNQTIKEIYEISNKNRKLNKQRKKFEGPSTSQTPTKEKNIYEIIQGQYDIDEKENGDYRAVMKMGD